MIKFNKVTKRFGEIIALEKVSFKIKAKEFVFVIGPSGAGKTTLVKLILREYLPTAGSVRVLKKDLQVLRGRQIVNYRRKIGVVFQDAKLLPDRTVYENVALALRVRREREEVIKEEVENILAVVGLADRADLFPAQLAGGELQRTCLARAVVAKPEVLLADEPTGNLDPATSWQIIKLLNEINQLGCTVIVATHNFEVVNSLKKRVIELEKGRLVSDTQEGKYQIK
jgi:cell division transport system ATP-binding protein